MKPLNNNKLLGVFGLLFLTFGISYFDFENIYLKENTKPFFMILLGIISLTFFFISKRKAQK